MRLVGELKEKVEKAKSKEEAKLIRSLTNVVGLFSF